MKNTLIVTAFVVGLGASTALAADDFGAPFTGQAPAGFSDVQPNDDTFNIEDFDPNAIEPAAGDESEGEPTAVEQDIEAEQTPPEDIEEDTENVTGDEISL